MRKLELDSVLMVVANDPWQKTNQNLDLSDFDALTVSTPEDRFEMLKRAVDEHEDLTADDMEIVRGGRTYTIDTVSELNNRFPESELFLLIGSDVAKDFDSWRDPQEICRRVNVVVLTRPGTDRSEVGEDWDFSFLDIPAKDISAKEIRLRVSNGESLEGMVPYSVEEYILAAGLYRE
jgi:nicotinate-nucleotide adenylyltransferase